MRGLGFAAALVALVACSPEDDAAPRAAHPSRLRVRVLVAQADAPKLEVYDAADRETTTAALPAVARELVVSHTGETVAATLTDDSVQLVSAGVAVIPHKGHLHIYKAPVEPLGTPSAAPSRAAFGRGEWALFQPDGAAASRVVAADEGAWLQGAREPRMVTDRVRHRGYAVAIDGGLLASRRAEADEGALGDGVELVAADSVRGVAGCADVSAAASSGRFAAFACREGVLLIDAAGASKGVVAVPGRVRSLASVVDRDLFLLRTEEGATFVLDAVASRATRVEIDACDAVLEIATTPRVVALTPDGRLHLWDPGTTRVVASTAPVVPPFACADAVRPRIGASPERAWVTSPSTRMLHEVDTVGGAVLRSVPLTGVPGAVAVVGLDARNVDLGPGSDRLTD